LFEIETILSARLREKSTVTLDENIDLNSLASKPFDTDGLAVEKPAELSKPSVSVEAMLKRI